MLALKGNNLSRVKSSNQSAILRMIYYDGPIKRSEIAERLELTLPTITTNVNKMLKRGLVSVVCRSAEENGRHAELLGVNAKSQFFAGVELLGERWSVCISDFCGNILISRSGVMKNKTYHTVMRQLADRFGECLAKSGRTKEDISGIGLCLPGLIDRENGILCMNSNYKWTDKAAGADFAELTGYEGRITVENNVTARGISARIFHWKELEQGQSFAYMLVASGIACPVFQSSMSYRGSVVGTGEAGHMVIDPHGRACSCGKRGCLEAYASESSLIRECVNEMNQGRALILRELCTDPKHPGMEEILMAQKEGDRDVSRVIEEAIYILAIAVSNIINYTRPDTLFIDCKLLTIGHNRELLLNKAKSALSSPTYYTTDIRCVEAEQFANALGGVAVAIDENLEKVE